MNNPSELGAHELTPEMLDAGEQMLVEEIGICGADIGRGIARSVFTAMYKARPEPADHIETLLKLAEDR